MIKSLRTLFSAPYNRERPLFAFYRFCYWKWIRLFRRKDVQFRFWGDRKLGLDYDSAQSMWIMYNYLVDWEEFNLISAYVRPGDQLMDIGANIGLYTLWMSRFVGSGGKVHSFEPDKTNFSKLQMNISANALEDRVRVNEKALSDIDGSLCFTTGLDKENHIAASDEPGTVVIPAQRLDSYAEANGVPEIAYLKIDVEGFEYSVLRGAYRLLSEKKVQVIQLEINHTIQHSSTGINDLLQLLRDHRFVLCRYDVASRKLVPVDYTVERENYFAVYDLEKSNLRLKKAL
jgi:FkbM family methyltransferase